MKLRVEREVLWLACAAFTLACGGSGAHSSTGSTATTGGSGITASTGAMGSSGTTSAAGTTGAISSGAAAASGNAGASTGMSSGAGRGTGASAGVSSSSGEGADAGSGDMDGGSSDSDIGGDGPLAVAGCANNNYPLCIDFEDGIDTSVWTGGTPSAIVTTDFAHGGHSYRLYPMSGGVLKATKLGTITNQLWGRFYVHFEPGAPGGHGNILGAYDQSNNWYEIGWQFNGILGDYHAANGERPLRSMPTLVDQWYCIESFFDGTQTNMPAWWINGQVPDYYMPDNTTLIPKIVTQFMTITVGFTPYAGLGLNDNPYGNSNPPVLADMWIDDIAFDTKRIGCIQ
jgi:hypothetical protein